MEFFSVSGSVAVPFRFLIGVVAGVVATLGMDLVMGQLPEGTTPPAVASGILTERTPAEAPGRLASVVHYLAGTLTGPLFVWLLFASEALFGTGVGATLSAAAVLYVLMVGFFAVIVLPRSLVAAGRVPIIRRDWAIVAAVYIVVLVPLVVLASRLL